MRTSISYLCHARGLCFRTASTYLDAGGLLLVCPCGLAACAVQAEPASKPLPRRAAAAREDAEASRSLSRVAAAVRGLREIEVVQVAPSAYSRGRAAPADWSTRSKMRAGIV